MVDMSDCDVAGARKVIEAALAGKESHYMTQAECRPLLACYRLPIMKSGIACSADEAAKLAEEIGGPLAMKVMSADVIHKYDAGGVLLKIVGAEQARAAYAQIYKNVESHVPGAKIQGILIEQMAPKGVEVILGASRDARFGPLMMFGLGGTMVEILKDVTFRLAPMWQISAERMVRSIKAFKILDGFRGKPPADVDAIVDILLRLSHMVCNHPEISELDINPLIVHDRGKGCSVADSRVMLRKPACADGHCAAK
jgi:acetyltransferase